MKKDIAHLKKELNKLSKVAEKIFNEVVIDNFEKYDKTTALNITRVYNALNIIKKVF